MRKLRALCCICSVFPLLLYTASDNLQYSLIKLSKNVHIVETRDPSDAYAGPFLVLERETEFFKVEEGQYVEAISVDRLKPHTGSSLLRPATAASRGRPKRQAAALSV
jgi:hypothetical protein